MKTNNKKDDEYFMKEARKIAKKSTDISTKVGCVIVDTKNQIIAKGFNSFPLKCNKKYMTNEKPMRYLLSVHAEMRALLTSKTKSFKNCRAYVTHASCENCLKHLIVSGVKEIIYEKLNTNGHFIDKEKEEAIVRLMKSSKIIHRNINGKSFIEDIKNN